MHLRKILLLLTLILSVCGMGGCVPVVIPPASTATLSPPPTATAMPTTPPTPIEDRSSFYELMVFPEAGSRPVLDAISSAGRSIHMVMYLFTSQDVLEALKSAAGRGVQVWVMLEENPFGGGKSNRVAAEELRQAGVHVNWGNPVFQYTHEKCLIIDERWMMISTGNMTTSTFTANRDFAVISTHADDVAEALRVFAADWERGDVDLSAARLVWSPETARRRILEMIDAAQASIDLEEQSLQDEAVIALLEGAAARGVRVRLLSSPQAPLEDDLNEPGRDRLRRAGGQVRYQHDPYIHAKAFIVDGEVAFVGSQNLTATSLDLNRELGIVVADPLVISRLEEVFARDWQEAAENAFPEPVATVPPAGYIDHTQAMQYLYQEVTVGLTVTHVYNSGRVIWLMGDGNQETNFKVVIFPNVYYKWPEPPDDYYFGRTIRAHGVIELYRGWPEIVVEDPSQIEVVR